MILRLVREQLRSMWRYTAWSAGLLAFAVALGTYALVAAATALQFQYYENSISQRENTAVLYSVFSADGAPVANPKVIGLYSIFTYDEVQAMIARAASETSSTTSSGSSVEAVVQLGGNIEGSTHWLTVAAITPPIAWDRHLASGNPPQHGEIAISQQIANEFGLTVGDTITLGTDDTGRGGVRHAIGLPPTKAFVISGTVKADSVAPYWHADPDLAYVPWSDVQEIALGLSLHEARDQATGELVTVVRTIVAWNGDSATLAPFVDTSPWRPIHREFGPRAALDHTDTAGNWLLVASGLAVLGMMIAAFGMGRAQAEARAKWTATARVLGATRRTIAASSVLETALVSLAGIALGLGAGIAAAAAHLAHLRTRHPEALLPSGPSVPASLVFAGVVMGLVIAAAVAAVPAFWASRVAPVASLKPVTPVGEATGSRSVSRWWLVGLLAGTAIVGLAVYTVAERGRASGGVLWADISLLFVLLIGAVVGFTTLVDGLRSLLPAIADRIAAIPRPWAVAAGDSLRTHRRLFTYASVSMALIVGAFARATTYSAFEAINWDAGWSGGGDPPMFGLGQYLHGALLNAGFIEALVGLLSVATFVAIIITLSSRTALAADAATRAALGLSKAQESVAAAVRQWTPMVMGVLVGGLLGWVLTLGIRFAMALASPGVILRSAHWNLTVAGYAAAATSLVVGVALGVSLAGSLLVGLLARPGTPVQALRRAAGVRS